MFAGSSKLTIKDLVIDGVHGSTGREPHDKQRFKVSLSMEVDANAAAYSDMLADSFDYKIAIAVAKHVVETERYVLLEKIAGRIASRICQYGNVRSVEVSIDKLDASQGGIPSFTAVMKRTPQEQHERLRFFDAEALAAKLATDNAVSFPVLPDSYRKVLLDEAEMYNFIDGGYVQQAEVIGPYKVREQLSTIKNLFTGSLFHRLRNDFLWHFKARLKDYPATFPTALDLNEIVLQKYDKGSIGITPHRDFVNNVNLICIFVLTGKSSFATCDDRNGTNPKFLDTTPGNVILMRAPGYAGSDLRPFHFVSDILERRIVCVMRQLKA